MPDLPWFLKDKNLQPNIAINPDFWHLGTEVAFNFGARVMELEKQGKFERIYKFHIGDTGPKTPQPIIDVAIKALQDKQTKYAPFLGFPQVRENIAKYWTETRGIKVSKENVMLGPGGKPAIELAIQLVAGPGVKVVGQNPGFPIYESLGNFYTQSNYIPWLPRRDEATSTFEFRVEDLEKILQENDKVRLVIINTPQNPTGMILSKEKLEKIAELVRKYKFLVMFDDIYDRIVFNGKKHFSFLSIPDMFDYTVNLNGLSKNFAMTGWRIGIIIAPEWIIETFGQLAINKWSCVNRVGQIVAGTIFGEVEVDGHKYASVAEEVDTIVEHDCAEYEKKGKFLVAALRLLEPYVVPNEVQGAFYEFPNFENVLALPYVQNDLGIKSDKDFSNWLLEEKGFAALAGSDFGEGGKGYLRLSYAEDRDKHIIPGTKYLMKLVIELIVKSDQTPPLAAAEVEEKVGELAEKYFAKIVLLSRRSGSLNIDWSSCLLGFNQQGNFGGQEVRF